MKDELMDILEEKKVLDVVLLDLRKRSALFDYFIIGTVESTKQAEAVVEEIDKRNVRVHHIEYSPDGGWTLVDCFDVVVHLFSEQKREEYNIESLYLERE